MNVRVKVKVFGSLQEICDAEFFMEAQDSQTLVAMLMDKHPALCGRKLLIAVNNSIIQENTVLQEQDTVALMPPYSGG